MLLFSDFFRILFRIRIRIRIQNIYFGSGSDPDPAKSFGRFRIRNTGIHRPERDLSDEGRIYQLNFMTMNCIWGKGEALC